MAERRMISKKITDTDAFLDMPLSTQALYFHFIQNADDDGFVGSPNSIVRKIGANKNDYDLLIVKRFIIQFDSGICVIKHWRIHNYIQTDRYVPTTYTKEKASLVVEENKSYTECIQDVSIMETQYSIDQISIDKSNNNMLSSSTQNEQDSPKEITIDVISQFEIFYKLYPCSISKNKKTSLNLYYNWLMGKNITIMGSKKLTRYNHLQMLFALKMFITVNENKEETFIPRLPTFLGEKTLCDFVENSKEQYETYMLEKYGENWAKIKFVYLKNGV